MNFSKYILFLVFILSFLSITAQDDLMDMLEAEMQDTSENENVWATFKAIKVINAQTIETVKGKSLDFRVGHRFGNIIEQASGSGGFHEFFGIDNAADIRISFDYGITDNIQIGFGRSKQMEALDGSFKWRFLSQTENSKMPVSAVWFTSAAFTPARDPDSLYQNLAHRLSYVHQLVIARKFSSWLSLEVLPTIVHRNVVRRYFNEKGQEEENTFFALGIAGRIKVTKRIALVADYFHLFSNYRSATADTRDPFTNYYAPLGVGVEIETGGHVFTINFTNSGGITENNFLPNTTDSWSTGAFKYGFNISRVFHF
ncbi:MAG: hypothetical protein COA57_08885 [Flavobacteriales bacterium]|nr:MAG: hypothetical protein COA57_08885 [Flavobacteriales bacterium]